jgi:hypothetical protein
LCEEWFVPENGNSDLPRKKKELQKKTDVLQIHQKKNNREEFKRKRKC